MGDWNTWVTGLSGKVGWYKLDETSGTSATDSSGAGNTGAYTGTIGFSGSSLIPSESGSKSVTMDGSGDNMQATGALYTTQAGTLIATIKSSTDQTGRMFQGAGAPATYWRIDNNQSKAIFGGNVYDLGYDPTPVFDGAAKLVMYILRTTSTELWIGDAASGFSMVGSTAHAEASVVDGYTFLKGASQGILAEFDDFVILNRAISSTEANDGYTAWLGAPVIPEVAAAWEGAGSWTAEVVPVVEVAAAWAGVGSFAATVDGGVLTGPTPAVGDAPAPLPLTVRVGAKHITQEVSGLQFRKEAIGGLKSISLRLAHTLDKFDNDLAALSELYLFDGRNGRVIGQAKLTDPGRSASASDGQQWDMTAFAPGMADCTFPYALVDTSLEPFTRSMYSTRNATATSDERDEDNPSLVIAAEEGKTVSTSWIGDMIHRGFRQAGMKLGRVRARVDCGVTSANFDVQLITRTGAAFDATADAANASTTPTILAAQVVTDFTNGADVASIRAVRNTSGTTGTEDQWFEFWEIAIRALLLDQDGTEITTGYTQNYVLAHEVVKDLLGRVLDQIDGANSVIDEQGTYQIDQLAYYDGVTAEQVLTDLMALEPAYRYVVEPDGDGGYIFRWEPWPTSVRYEVTLNDGGDFPTSSQELYNEVTVRWRGVNGRTRSVTRTLACQILDDAGVTRSTIIDAGDEVGSAAAAARMGDNFLAEHNVPANAGTLTVARPIRDLYTNRWVRPHEIEAGELIRVRGIESYPDALNASSNDGQTVFRIWSVTYTSDSDSAALELDIPSRSTTNALVKLAKRRTRKR